MSDLPFVVIVGVIGAVIAAISIIFAKRQVDQTNASWQAAADALGFSFESGSMRTGPTISGTVDDHPATVHSYTKSSGKSSNRYTRYTVAFPPIGVGLKLSRQAGIGQFLKILGTQDIVIGDPTFDEAFIVKAHDPQAARSVLTPGRTMALNQLLAVHPDVVVTDDRIVIDRRGAVRETDVIVSTVRRLASAADLMADAGTSVELTTLVEQRLDGTMPSDYEADSTLPRGVDARIATGEALAAFGVINIAQKIFESLAAELPADRDIVGWSERTRHATEHPAPPADALPDSEQPSGFRTPIPPAESSAAHDVETPDPGSAPPVDTTPPVGDRVDRDAITLATDLFGENRLSFETAAIFDETYAGRSVLWSGKLRSETTVDHYRVLGDGPFTKAIVDVALIENDLFGNTVVTAIVAFPPGSIDSIDVGDNITFSGTLVGIDALVRNLFVGNARLSAGVAE